LVCAGHITNTTHLREVHKFDINVRTILEQFKDKKTRGAARLAVTHCIEFVNQIRIKPSHKLIHTPAELLALYRLKTGFDLI
jgi:hypothetical protein